MPAVSKKQQRLFGMVHALQKGTLSKDKVSPEIRHLAKSIDPESVSHFAETKHTKLPEKKKKNAEKKAMLLKAAETALFRHTLRRFLHEALVRNTK